MFELSALGQGWGDFAATARAGLVPRWGVRYSRHRAVRKGNYNLPRFWRSGLALLGNYILIVEECDKQLPFVGHSCHAGPSFVMCDANLQKKDLPKSTRLRISGGTATNCISNIRGHVPSSMSPRETRPVVVPLGSLILTMVTCTCRSGCL